MTRSRSPDTPGVLLVGTGRVAERTARLLQENTVTVERRPAQAPFDDLVVSPATFAAVALAADRPLPTLEHCLNEQCHALKLPWTAGVLLANRFRIGPTVVPGRTPCLDCFERRLRSQAPHLPSHDALTRFAAIDTRPIWFTDEFEALTEQVPALLAAEVVSLASGSSQLAPYGLGSWWDGDIVLGALERHLFSRIGGCPRCDPPSAAG
ncbi:TOMM precursor leader peptide-binding protein [Streptomyces canus]|uniref:TOMM precursor leader peptide-binding protein n=1 Tax=Streptomyces canus TaxID=58343 RepID=UPI002E2BE1EC|nr:TOMM precursor leader peptide-binding protein [Streptomyces canus]